MPDSFINDDIISEKLIITSIRKKRFKELFIECFTDFLSDFSEAMEKYENLKRSEKIILLTEKRYQERFNIIAEANNYLQKKL